jgi:hypothetical protein
MDDVTDPAFYFYINVLIILAYFFIGFYSPVLDLRLLLYFDSLIYLNIR